MFEHQGTIVLCPDMEGHLGACTIKKMGLFLNYPCTCTDSVLGHRTHWDNESTDLEPDFPSTADKLRTAFLHCEPMFRLTGYSASLLQGER